MYKIGQEVEAKVIKIDNSIKNIELSLKKSEKQVEYELGDIVFGKICNKNRNGLRVQISDNVHANVHLLEISDEWLLYPLNKFEKN